MDWLFGIGKWLLVIFAVANIVGMLYINRRRLDFAWDVWKRFRFLMLLEVLVVMSLTIAIIVVLWVYVPFLNWGWLSIFVAGGGNALISPVMDVATADEGSSNNFLVWLVPLFFLVLVVALPFLAHSEEKSFRKGKHYRGEIVWSSVTFGLMHLLVGIPICAGIGLIGVGFFYAYKYKRAYNRLSTIMHRRDAEEEAVMVSTTYHTLYNTILIGVLLVIVIQDILQ